jgi:hypothetical protein
MDSNSGWNPSFWGQETLTVHWSFLPIKPQTRARIIGAHLLSIPHRRRHRRRTGFAGRRRSRSAHRRRSRLAGRRRTSTGGRRRTTSGGRRGSRSGGRRLSRPAGRLTHRRRGEKRAATKRLDLSLTTMQSSFPKESSVISFRGFFVKIHGFNEKPDIIPVCDLRCT